MVYFNHTELTTYPLHAGSSPGVIQVGATAGEKRGYGVTMPEIIYETDLNKIGV